MTSRWTLGIGSSALPPNWERSDGADYCLVCRRERAIELAIEQAGPALSTADRAKLRSSAVVEFEIARDPERTEGEIAKASRTSIGAVRRARKVLEAAGP